MKNRVLRLLALGVLAALLAGTCLSAAAASASPKLITAVLWIGTGKSPVVISDLPAKAKITSISSSKTSVLKVGKEANFGPHGLWLKPVKAGKSKVTVKYKVGSSTKKVSATFQVKKYPEPFEYIKVNGKRIDLSKNMTLAFFEGYAKSKITVTFKLKSDWKAVSCGGSRIKGEQWKSLTWKKGQSISLSKYDGADLVIDVKNKKTGETCNYEIAVWR